jgi:predicted DsbA family dithiol-disulfide isomerase
MITIDYFSDVLCVWAYGGQIRLDELQKEYGEHIQVRYRFMGLFGDTRTRIGDGWQDGGFEGFGRHMQEVCRQWQHTHLHPDVWTRCRPLSCTTAHAFLKAAALCLDPSGSQDDREKGRILGQLIDVTRIAFFERAQDISKLSVLLGLLDGTSLGADAVVAKIENGEAYAALHADAELMKTYGVLGSPTYVFNEGRQLLYGNVGFRIIESNVRELLSSGPVAGAPSWC